MPDWDSDVDPPVRLIAYDPSWPARFASERALLAPLLAPWLAGPIEHIGSTAVPGLAAKPVIDIAAAVRTLPDSLAAIPSLPQLGYLYAPYKTEVMHWFCKPARSFRTHHLHLVPLDSPLWSERLAFRDYLRRHPDAAAQYAELKRRLAEEHELDREAYTDAKGPFVARILNLARVEISASV
jgi:GrpB-like predicted nucleotidyltransferase (UPF0157 family)